MPIILPAAIFTDGMVLQRDRRNPVWGAASVDGAKVSVEFLGREIDTTVKDGKWRADLEPASAGGPYEIKIKCRGDEITIRDVLVGEVWIAGGQSNMEYPLVNSRHGYLEIPAADYPDIRVYTVPRITHENLAEDPAADEVNAELVRKARWKACSPKTAGEFYAVAFHFAKELNKSLGVPVGIIECAWGGTSAACWMSEEMLASDPDTRIYLDEYLDYCKEQGWEDYQRACMEYDEAIAAYEILVKDIPLDYADIDAYFERANSTARYPWPPALGPMSPLRPCGLYHTMVRKIVPYGERGVIFYQGETDTCRPAMYGRLFGNMMENWRQEFENPNLPFLITQLSAFANDNDVGTEYALLREQQAQLAKQHNCALVVTNDCGHRTNIHPLDKKTVGERLAAQAKATVYGMDVPHAGPEFRHMAIEGSKAIVSFGNADGGMVALGTLKGFQLAGGDKKFVAADAQIAGDKVILTAAGIEEPVAVRYGFANYMEASLYNAEGFPAVPFRTDDWI